MNKIKEIPDLKDVVIDIETLSTSNNALIISIGMVCFDYKTYVNDPEYLLKNSKILYYEIDLEDSQKRYDFDIDVKTIKFWIEQVQKKSISFPNVLESTSLETALNELLICDSDLIESYWAHSNFDHNILNNACRKLDLEYFDYRKCRDLRTLEMIGNKFNINRRNIKYKPLIPHNALYDATAEALYVSDVLRCLDNAHLSLSLDSELAVHM